MKNLLLIAVLMVGLSFGSVVVYGQDEVAKTEAESKADHQDKSKVGNVLHETGSAIGNGAKWTGKKIGQGAKWTGQNVADGASWTWDKAKHNKLTKNTFNQPGDE